VVRSPGNTTEPYWDSTAQQLDALADRITQNRVIAGVHFPVDGEAGKALAVWLAEYFLASCVGDAVVEVTARKYTPGSGELPAPCLDVKEAATANTVTLPPHAALKALLQAARLEWMALEELPAPQQPH